MAKEDTLETIRMEMTQLNRNMSYHNSFMRRIEFGITWLVIILIIIAGALVYISWMID